jgi:hypothetical protein
LLLGEKILNHKVISLALIGSGVGMNLLDAYFSGNLPFSPASSTTMNPVTQANNFLPVATGTILAVAGIALFIFG